MIRKLRCLRGDEGASLVELALASAIFLAILIGSFEAMLCLYSYHFLSEAAREASRYAMVRGSTSCTNTPSLTDCDATSAQIQSYVRGLGYPEISRSQINVTTTWLTVSSGPPASWSACTSGTCNAPGNQVKVVATYPFPLNVPFVPKLSVNLSSTSQMVISQ